MNIEQRFLLKAMKDRNFVCFNYENKSFKNIKPLKFENNLLYTNSGNFEITKIKKIIVLKDKF